MSENTTEDRSTEIPPNFVEERVAADRAAGRNAGRVQTRFPPEPNGYLHIGHAKSICLNFGLAQTFQGKCNLRFDDTNPETEEVEFVESIQADVRWLGFQWDGAVRYASDYFQQLHDFAVTMIQAGDAYVDGRTTEEIRATRGDFHTVGTPSADRSRSVAENLDLFARMKDGEFADGTYVLRAKGDLASADMKMRDPLMYRIRHAHHHRTGDAWCIYPIYDWAHGQSDFIEEITHSICTLEFVNHRPLYHWFLDKVGAAPLPDGGASAPAASYARPEQIEFARLQLTYTVLSKRRLQELVEKKFVAGWDDPRMPTLAGLRRRGYPAAAIRAFCERIGVATRDAIVDVSLLEFAVREALNATAPRSLAVLDPVKVVLENFEEAVTFDAPFGPDLPGVDSEAAKITRKLRLTKEIFIEREDFMEVPEKKFFRLAPGQEVRLRWACIIKATRVEKDETGKITTIYATWDPDSVGGQPKDGRKIKGTIHWVSAEDAIDAEVRLYDRLFQAENPMGDKENWLASVNPNSLQVVTAKLEPSLAARAVGECVQFERIGYFTVDKDSAPGRPVFNRTIALKDSWSPKK
jgi:glutaminyl-tRNA synthetase